MLTQSYVAFLRGINVGGSKKVSMEDLKKAFTSLDFRNIRTLLNSGNVIFEAKEEDSGKLAQKIEQCLKKKIGFEIPTLIRTLEEIESLEKLEPFKGINITP